MSKPFLRYLRALLEDVERYATFQYDQSAGSPEQYDIWDRRFEENTTVEVFDSPIVNQPREPYYQNQLYGKTSAQSDPSYWKDDTLDIFHDEGLWIDSDDEAAWDVFAHLAEDDDEDKEAAPRRKPSKPSAYRQYRQYWRKNRQKYREKKRKQRMQYKRKKNKILRRRQILKRRTPGRIRKPQSF